MDYGGRAAAACHIFDLRVEDDDATDSPFRHLISTGHVSAMADRWGNVNLFTTEGGFTWLNPPDSCIARGSIYLMMEVGGELISLIYSELTHKQLVRMGTGSIEYHGELKMGEVHLRVVEEVFALPNRDRRIHARFCLTNLSSVPFEGRLEIRGDVTPTRPGIPGPKAARVYPSTSPGWAVFPGIDEQLGDVFLAATEAWPAASKRDYLCLAHTVRIAPGAEFEIGATTGYGPHETPPVSVPTLDEAHQQWATRLAPFAVAAPEPWMARECLWNAGQLLSFSSYDSSVGETYIALGGLRLGHLQRA